MRKDKHLYRQIIIIRKTFTVKMFCCGQKLQKWNTIFSTQVVNHWTCVKFLQSTPNYKGLLTHTIPHRDLLWKLSEIMVFVKLANNLDQQQTVPSKHAAQHTFTRNGCCTCAGSACWLNFITLVFLFRLRQTCSMLYKRLTKTGVNYEHA